MLQPDHYDADELAVLTRSGTELMAYLSLGEDPVPGGPWQRNERNRLWGVSYVHVAHPGWREHVLGKARAALDVGFDGFLLDTIETPDLFPEDSEPMVDLVRAVRELADGYVVANRGIALMEPLSGLVDGFLFEGFSTTWLGGYRALPRDRLALNVEIAHELQSMRRDMYALDYAVTPELASFATNRAVAHGLAPQVSNKLLTRL